MDMKRIQRNAERLQAHQSIPKPGIPGISLCHLALSSAIPESGYNTPYRGDRGGGSGGEVNIERG